jgi:hypothetical protein
MAAASLRGPETQEPRPYLGIGQQLDLRDCVPVPGYFPLCTLDPW